MRAELTQNVNYFQIKFILKVKFIRICSSFGRSRTQSGMDGFAVRCVDRFFFLFFSSTFYSFIRVPSAPFICINCYGVLMIRRIWKKPECLSTRSGSGRFCHVAAGVVSVFLLLFEFQNLSILRWAAAVTTVAFPTREYLAQVKYSHSEEWQKKNLYSRRMGCTRTLERYSHTAHHIAEHISTKSTSSGSRRDASKFCGSALVGCIIHILNI